MLHNQTLNRILDRLAGVMIVALIGDTVWVQRAGGGDAMALPSVESVPPPELPPPRLPAEVRDGLITRRHLRTEPIQQPLLVRGEAVSFEGLEAVIAEGIRKTRSGLIHRMVKPTMIATAPGLHFHPRKRTLLDAMKRAGARQVFLVEFGSASALGVEIDVVTAKAVGLLVMEADFAEFCVIGYADQLCHAVIPFGVNDVQGPDDCLLEKLADMIATALGELREPQVTELVRQGVTLVGRAADVPWLPTALAAHLDLAVHPRPTSEHPALLGLSVYADHIHEWKATMISDDRSRQAR